MCIYIVYNVHAHLGHACAHYTGIPAKKYFWIPQSILLFPIPPGPYFTHSKTSPISKKRAPLESPRWRTSPSVLPAEPGRPFLPTPPPPVGLWWAARPAPAGTRPPRWPPRRDCPCDGRTWVLVGLVVSPRRRRWRRRTRPGLWGRGWSCHRLRLHRRDLMSRGIILPISDFLNYTFNTYVENRVWNRSIV